MTTTTLFFFFFLSVFSLHMDDPRVVGSFGCAHGVGDGPDDSPR